MEVVSGARGPFGRWIMPGLVGSKTRVRLDRRHREAGAPGTPVPMMISTDPDAECEAIAGRGGTIPAQPATDEWNPDMSRAILRDSEGSDVLLTTP